jgi:predicted permease
MVIVWAAVGLLLLIACANVAGLLLARGTARRRDLAIRAALGCGELRLMRYLAIESVLLGAIGGSIGTALGASAIPVLKGLLPASLPRAADVTVDGRVLAAGAVLSVVMALLFGMLPSLRAARAPAAGALRTRGAMERSSLLRTATVGAQIAITLVLLVGAALASRSMLKAASVPPGFNPDDVLTVDLSLPSARYPEVDDHRRFYAAVLDRVSAGARVTAAAVTGTLPLGGSPATDFTAEGSPPRDAVTADIVPATPAYFRAMEIQVVAGRTFSASDRDGGPPVAIVSESAARALWPGMNPLGRRFTMHDWGEPYDATVVGIVADVHQNGLDAAPSSSVYYPFAQFPHTTLSNSIVIRHAGNLASATAVVRSAIRRADPGQPITRVAAFTDILSRSLAERRFNALLVTVFGLMALALSVVGLYGLVAYLLQSRRREIAVRVALGASPSRIVRLAVLLAARPVSAGMVAGLVAAAWAARAAQSLLFGVTAGDPASFAAAVAIVAGAAAAALAVPLFRALGADPVSGLRAD